HASVRDGLKMSSARSFGFIHNDVKDLERLLSKYRENDQEQLIFVAIEALYSMSGELAPIERMVEICEHYKAILIVDEAHSCGVYGEEGRGYVDQLGLADRIPIRLVTFGKAYGAHGAMVLGSKDLRTFLINYARSLIYTTAISERTVERIYRNVIDPDNEDRRVKLKENIARFRRVFSSETLISDEQSPIQILRGTRNELQLLNDRLKKANIAAKVILPPTVPEGKECIRIVIHAFNSDSELDLLIQTLKQQK
ncbi:MAG: pyridoxal phosphate-dependent aminotransferase family protein, partial [Bacteroidetes bacterium]